MNRLLVWISFGICYLILCEAIPIESKAIFSRLVKSSTNLKRSSFLHNWHFHLIGLKIPKFPNVLLGVLIHFPFWLDSMPFYCPQRDNSSGFGSFSVLFRLTLNYFLEHSRDFLCYYVSVQAFLCYFWDHFT